MTVLAARAAVRTMTAILIVTLLFGVGLLLLEGGSSAILVLSRLANRGETLLAERQHTEYDSELGWVNRPNVFIPDLYGKGVYLQTNSQRFRNTVDFGLPAAAGKVRVVCSGDSFTLGYGVDNDHTWCQSLATIDSRIESVNMGQGGYGIDQAYLWYRRDGVQLDPEVHLFAFINDDFNRIRRGHFLGYGKPVLRLRDGALLTSNVPVPRAGAYARGLSRWLPLLRELRAFELAAKLGSRVGREAESLPPDEARAVALRIFESLHDLAQTRQHVFVLVYLPTADDCRGRPRRIDWWNQLRQDAVRAGITVIDLTERCRQLTAPEADAWFIAEDEVPYSFATGHYTIKGNESVAAAIYAELARLPSVRDRLTQTGGASHR